LEVLVGHHLSAFLPERRLPVLEDFLCPHSQNIAETVACTAVSRRKKKQETKEQGGAPFTAHTLLSVSRFYKTP
jgi:hypothetical protein